MLAAVWYSGACESAVLTRSTSTGNVQMLAGDLSSGRAFDNGCTCHHVECRCGAPRLRAQLEFVGALVNVSKRLSQPVSYTHLTLPTNREV